MKSSEIKNEPPLTLKHLGSLVDEYDELERQTEELWKRQSILREEIPRVRMLIAMKRKRPVQIVYRPTPPLRQYVGMIGFVTKVNPKSCLVDFGGTSVRVPSWELGFAEDQEIKTAGQMLEEHRDE